MIFSFTNLTIEKIFSILFTEQSITGAFIFYFDFILPNYAV